jgi:hypothetical protein
MTFNYLLINAGIPRKHHWFLPVNQSSGILSDCLPVNLMDVFVFFLFLSSTRAQSTSAFLSSQNSSTLSFWKSTINTNPTMESNFQWVLSIDSDRSKLSINQYRYTTYTSLISTSQSTTRYNIELSVHWFSWYFRSSLFSSSTTTQSASVSFSSQNSSILSSLTSTNNVNPTSQSNFQW